MTVTRRVVIVEDEQDIAELLSFNLRKEGYEVSLIHDGAKAYPAIRAAQPDLVILDLMLPNVSGMDIAQKLRADPNTSDVRILMLTAKATEPDQLAGLTIGADDYVSKPFSMKVVMARVAALLRRGAVEEPASKSSFGPIEIDSGAHTIHIDGEEGRFTLTEFRILLALVRTPRRVLSRAELIGRVMGPGVIVTARTVDVHMAAIRRKLGEHGWMIRTIRGVGYQITDQAAAPADGVA